MRAPCASCCWPATRKSTPAGWKKPAPRLAHMPAPAAWSSDFSPGTSRSDAMLEWSLMALGGYLLGSISGSLVLGRFRGIDIRAMGSGNAGGTNALRTVGWGFALGVVLIDVGKGWVAAGLLPLLFAEGGSTEFLHYGAVAGFAAVLGHIWPLYFRFRGGKGAGTAVGVVLSVAPWCFLPLLTVW